MTDTCNKCKADTSVQGMTTLKQVGKPDSDNFGRYYLKCNACNNFLKWAEAPAEGFEPETKSTGGWKRKADDGWKNNDNKKPQFTKPWPKKAAPQQQDTSQLGEMVKSINIRTSEMKDMLAELLDGIRYISNQNESEETEPTEQMK